MRMMAIVSIPVETGNEKIIDGTLPKIIGGVLEAHHVESAFFTVDGGDRTGFFVFDMSDISQMVTFAEPFFLAFSASIEFKPVMTPDDLMRSAPLMEAAAKKYGS